jgi:3-hydroxybutyryl-CoA dehydrogenase
VIEAAPEDLALKVELFKQLDRICPPPAILATNTSTLPVTAIAAAAASPERVAGLHFFNPAPVLPLVEIVRGAQTGSQTVQSLVALAEKLGKTAVVVRDTPGFIVNRVARPFYGEALRILGENAASHVQIDRIVRLGGGFRMGPFQLMDLIGIDINLSATQSMYEQTFGEQRYRPHLIQAQMVQQKALGRKTGRGFYTYSGAGPEKDKEPPRPVMGSGRLIHVGGSWAPGLIDLARRAGFTITPSPTEKKGDLVLAIVTAGKEENLAKNLVRLDRDLPPEIPILCQCAGITLTEISTWMHHPERLAGFDGLFFANGPIATLVASPTLVPKTRRLIEAFVSGLGRIPEWVEDSPALVLPRIVCMLANEAAFALQEGIAESEKIDLAMRLGVNYPRGPLAWAKDLGYGRVVAVLDHLRREYREDRYRVAPILRRWDRLELVLA